MKGPKTRRFNVGFLANLKLLAVVFTLLIFFVFKIVLTLQVYVLLVIVLIGYVAHRHIYTRKPSAIQSHDNPKDFGKTKNSINVCIVGSGFSGICMAVGLKKANISFTMFEKSADIGGTWFDNKYPGCACDLWTPLYQFSFYRNPDWSQFVAPASEIQSYLRNAVKMFGLEKHISLTTEVKRAKWQEDIKSWSVRTNKDEEDLIFTHIVSGCGALRSPLFPTIPGMESFQGTSFHSQQWDTEYNYKGKRVGIIGSAASAVQIAPAIADDVEELYIFQRTPNWHVQKVNPVYPRWLKTIFRLFPFIMWVMQTFCFHLLEFNRILMFRTGLVSSILQVKHYLPFDKS